MENDWLLVIKSGQCAAFEPKSIPHDLGGNSGAKKDRHNQLERPCLQSYRTVARGC